MEIICLEKEKMRGISNTHEYLRAAFGFSDYYGMNLDALYDCLTEIDHDVTIMMPAQGDIHEALGDYGLRLLRVFTDAAEYNGHLNIRFQQ